MHAHRRMAGLVALQMVGPRLRDEGDADRLAAIQLRFAFVIDGLGIAKANDPGSACQKDDEGEA
jgi:hypothetical protein